MEKIVKEANFFLSNTVFDSVSFVSRNEKDSNYWLAMNINYSPIEMLFGELSNYASPVTLRNRGEAYITVVTPPEYNDILKPYISGDQIDAIAESMNMQQSSFYICCLGLGEAYDDSKTLMQTY